MKKTSLLIILTSFLLFIPAVTQAFSYESRENVIIDSGKTVEGSVYALGKNISIEGNITGDLICAGETVNIRGKIGGDVICAGDTLNVESEVGGSVRLVGNNIYINSNINRNLNAISANTIIGSNTSIGWDALLLGAQAEMRGKINGNLHGYLQKLSIAGQVLRDVDFRISDDNDNSGIRIENGAQVLGNLRYQSVKQAVIADGATISGEVQYTAVEAEKKWDQALKILQSNIISIFSAFITALIIISIFRKKLEPLYYTLEKNIGINIGWGTVALILTPIIAIILLITLIGIPIALILFALWLCLLYISKVMVAIFVGRKIMERFWVSRKDNQILAIVFGVLVLWILCSLPFIGWAINLVVILWGLGSLFVYWRSLIKQA